MATTPAKICQICHQDCSKKPRVKDGQGRYSCEECLAQKQAEAALLAGADPAPGPERKPIMKKPAAAPAAKKPAAPVLEDEALPAGFWDAPSTPAATGAAAATFTCPNCRCKLSGGAVVCTSCGFNTKTGRTMKIKTGVDGGVSAGNVAAGAGKGVLRLGLWLLGGGIAGAISLAIWIAIAVFTGYEIGWVAIGVGALVGTGVAITGRQALNAVSGMVAAAIAFFCVAGWKIAAYFLLVAATNAAPQLVATGLEQQLNGPNGDSVAVERYAYRVAIDMESKGKKQVWPQGLESAGPDDRKEAPLSRYPEAVQKETRARWGKLTEAEKQAFKKQVVDDVKNRLQVASQSSQSQLANVFTAQEIIFMILWTVLACGMAFRIGANGFGGG